MTLDCHVKIIFNNFSKPYKPDTQGVIEKRNGITDDFVVYNEQIHSTTKMKPLSLEKLEWSNEIFSNKNQICPIENEQNEIEAEQTRDLLLVKTYGRKMTFV
jgi:hypothetical protein